MATIATPCTGICTLDEIARWSALTPDKRAALMAALPGRRTDGRAG